MSDTNEAPERIWVYGQDGYTFEDGTWDQADDPECSQDWPHARYMLEAEALAMVAAVVEEAAGRCDREAKRAEEYDWPDGADQASALASTTRLLTPDDARAALDRIKAEAHAAGVREGLERAAEMLDAAAMPELNDHVADALTGWAAAIRAAFPPPRD